MKAEDVTMNVQLLAYTPNPEQVIAAAAKLCYAKSDIQGLFDKLTPEKTEAFLEHLASLGHESPIEHVSFTFGIEGVSRALLAQITRHRLASYSVQSQRYVEKSGFDFVIPPEIEAIPEAREVFPREMEPDAAVYATLRELLADAPSLADMIASFMGVLELIKVRKIIMEEYEDEENSVRGEDTRFFLNPDAPTSEQEAAELEALATKQE